MAARLSFACTLLSLAAPPHAGLIGVDDFLKKAAYLRKHLSTALLAALLCTANSGCGCDSEQPGETPPGPPAAADKEKIEWHYKMGTEAL